MKTRKTIKLGGCVTNGDEWHAESARAVAGKATFAGFKQLVTGKAALPRRSAAKAGEIHFSVLARWLKTPAAKKFDEDLAAIKY